MCAILFSTSIAQNKLSKLHSKQKLDCIVCHECETPTKTNPCLAMCPRENVQVISYKVDDAPDTFTINNIKAEIDLYKAVSFSHKAHAEMSEMVDGCVTCHHYNPPGRIVKCNFCHETDRMKSKINMPDLKSAYHRQCMNCHSNWEDKSNCESCHKLNDNYKSQNSKLELVKTHTQPARPQTKVYKTDSEKGKVVTFHHNDHIKLFGAKCADCHKNEGCESCHNQKPNLKKLDIINHEECESCHNTDNDKQCVKCHKSNETKPFNHAVNTRFNLNKYHSKNSCRSCHKSKNNFKGLIAQCQSCHNCDEKNFKHSITGLQLSEDHLGLDCGDCHANNNYSKPTCIDCHEEDEGFVVPKKLPGKRVKK